jgi:hypothetical protein
MNLRLTVNEPEKTNFLRFIDDMRDATRGLTQDIEVAIKDFEQQATTTDFISILRLHIKTDEILKNSERTLYFAGRVTKRERDRQTEDAATTATQDHTNETFYGTQELLNTIHR